MNDWTWRRVICELVNMMIVVVSIAAFGFLTGFYEYLETI